MILKEQNDIRWMEFELLADFPLIHGCLLRHGGVSEGVLSSLNLGKSVEDKPENVVANFEKVAKNFNLKKVITAKLCHGVDVTPVSGADSQSIPLSDGLMTTEKDLALIVTQADCQAAIFYDPRLHVMANVHCGWRGNVQDIYGATVKAMQRAYGSNPHDLVVCVSPSLGPEYAEFVNYRTELPEHLWQFKIRHHHFDLWALSEWQLTQAGVLPHHMQLARIDTYDSDHYFSHRRSTHQKMLPCGRQATLCALL